MMQKPFKRPPKRFHPKGLSVLYEDHDILVADKMSGMLTVSREKDQRNTAHHLLGDYVRKGNSKSKHRVFIVHRLGRDTSGVIVFAKSEGAKRFLTERWQGFEKTYVALVQGAMPKQEGTIVSYLAENRAFRVYAVTDPNEGYRAETTYRVVKTTPRYSLLEIALITSHKDQVRVQLADSGNPVVGDSKYGVKMRGQKKLALHAATICLVHPYSKEKMTFTATTPNYFDALLRVPRNARKRSG